MKPTSLFLATASLALVLSGSPLNAEMAEMAVRQNVEPNSAASSSNAFARFTPASDRRDHTIDYQHWNEALGFMVIPMGPSLREGARRAEPAIGTRRIYGHKSRYRLEGNRVAFSFLSPNILSAVSEYRQDLERVGSELDLTRLPRNEQLAFWINLHNVAVIEALAREYPLSDPSEGKFGSNDATLQDAKLVTIKGVELSPRDIRERIVYPNWSDPKVMYGFWRGEIGGPSIQRLAYTGSNVDILLSLSAEEFVNSLRGVEAYGGALRVSEIYNEAKPFYFESDSDLKAHLTTFAREEVKDLINDKDRLAFNRYDGTIADMISGQRDPGIDFSCSIGGERNPELISIIGQIENSCWTNPTRNRAARRLVEERSKKLWKANRRGVRTGTVIYGDGRYSEGEEPAEVK